MSMIMILGIGVVAVILIIGGWAIALYNRLVGLRNMVQNSWSQIDVQLKRRFDLVPNIVATVKGYAAHEQQVLENVTQARAMVVGAQSFEQRQQGENLLSGALKSLFAVAESYPQLQASQNFMQLQQELSDLEAKIAFARQFYNDTTMKYNTALQSFPDNLIASMLGFAPILYFEADYRERETVQVRF